MENYTECASFTLPSKGKVYNTEINPNITIRSMTTEEEMKRLSPQQDRPYRLLCEIIDDCLVEKPGISAYDMCLGDYEFLLHKLRVVTYGQEYKMNVQCPYCYVVGTETINLEHLAVNEYSEELDQYMELDLPYSKKHIRLRVQTPRILDDIVMRTRELKKKSPDMKGDPALIFTIMNLIDTIDGVRPDEVKLEEFVRKLPMGDTNRIIQYGEKLNSKVGLATQFEYECGVCGISHSATFRKTGEFFGPSVDI
jgi:hypothetical protein